MKRINLLLITLLAPIVANATGMAVNLQNLYLQNFTTNTTTVTISNLDQNANTFDIPSHGICKINQPIMFLPDEEESNNFVISVKTAKTSNPIVIDKFGLLALASDSALQMPSQGNVKQYSLFGFCSNKYQQYKFLNVAPHNNESSAPDFRLANCKSTSNFVYLINDKYIKVNKKQKTINFSAVKDCIASEPSK
jgi:hypothetical protein